MTNHTDESICPTCSRPLRVGDNCLRCAAAGALDAYDEAKSEPSFSQFRSEAETSPGFGSLAHASMSGRFAHFEIKREIASGGMGTVYEAEDTKLRRTVALKMIRAFAFSSTSEKARFTAEAGAAAKLDHPNIVPIYEVGEFAGQPFFAMKLINGGTLATLLQKGALPPRTAASLMAKVARAVAHAHERGILHRDLKPGNILLDSAGEPHLTDFGLAKFAGQDSALTVSNAQLGTPQYMSPEQAAGRIRDISPQSDVWALGVILHQMLSGEPPFTGDGNAEVLRQVIETEAPALDLPRGSSSAGGLLSASFVGDLATLVARCLEKVQSRRLAGADVLADELERWLRGEPIQSRPVGRLERAARWIRRHPWPVATAAAAALAMGAIAFALTRHAPPPPTNAVTAAPAAPKVGRPAKVVATSFGPDGQLYLASQNGGRFGRGSLVRLDVTKSAPPVLVGDFSGKQQAPDAISGNDLAGGFVPAGDGSFYGAMQNGGPLDGGTIFRIRPGGAVETLYEFSEKGGARGPFGIELHSDGWLWGGAAGGCAAGLGGVFRFHPATQKCEVVFSVGGEEDKTSSGRSVRNVVELRPGLRVFLAAALQGVGTSYRPVIYVLESGKPPRVLHEFAKSSTTLAGGSLSAFCKGGDGRIYFTTFDGGHARSGTIQRVSLDGSAPEIVHEFTGIDGAKPFLDSLVPLADGTLCGITANGGKSGHGVVFAFTPPDVGGKKSDFRVLGNLHHDGGARTSLTPAADGTLIVSAANDRDSWIFRCDPRRQDSLKQLAFFPATAPEAVPGDPAVPGRPLATANGVLFGICKTGGKFGHGTIFRWKEGEFVSTVIDFTGTDGAYPGSNPAGQLAEGSDDSFYGMTEFGGPDESGIVFRLHRPSGKYTVLATPRGISATRMSGGMVAGADGLLYGTIPQGGAEGCGSVIRITPENGGRSARFEVLAEFTGPRGALPGNTPGPLSTGPDGALYGVTIGGGETGDGTAFRVAPEGVTTLGPLRFDGDRPAAHCLLAQGPDGWMYGVPETGKRFTLFRLNPATRAVELIPGPHGFGWGFWGWGGLVADGKGAFISVSANLEKFGGVQRMFPDGRYAQVAQFSGTVPLAGAKPHTEVVRVGDAFYGACPAGGKNNRGVLYKITAENTAGTWVEF